MEPIELQQAILSSKKPGADADIHSSHAGVHLIQLISGLKPDLSCVNEGNQVCSHRLPMAISSHSGPLP